MAPFRASVIINTIDRADSLAMLLEALRYQWTEQSFEVVVVTGPCTDHTLGMLEGWQGRLKHLECDEPNLSKSRNIGIAAAAGEVVVFIDDDALPEPRWLEELLDPFSDPEVVATGGYVWDHTGTNLQCRFNRSDRLGRSSFHAEEPLDDLCFPGAEEFPYVPGGNGAWRREHLISFGAFDENYEYYLDEVDVVVRAIDAGWKVAQIPGAAIHHKFLPSSVRNNSKVLLKRYPVLKNKILFGFFNGSVGHSMEEIIEEAGHNIAEHRRDLVNHIDRGRAPADALVAFEADAERALSDALEVGMSGGRRLGRESTDFDAAGAFLPFPMAETVAKRRRYVFVSQTIPPDPIGGIGRYMIDTARGLAAMGHEVRLITTGTGHDTIDLEEGVWIHRLVKPDSTDVEPPIRLGDIPQRIWANAVTVSDEVARLNEDHPVDAVYAAVWDTEAIAVQELLDIPVVVALVTSLSLAMESNPNWAQGPGFMEDFAEPMFRVEQRYLVNADVLHGISETIATEISRTSGVNVTGRGLEIAGLGVADPREGESAVGRTDSVQDSDPDSDSVNLLFVGRFEKRKGIDLLLEALAEVLPEYPELTATLVGRSDLVGPDGGTWIDWLDSEFPAAQWRNRLVVTGEIPDDELAELWASADIFVAPSRFESFGLIYAEAMAHGVPLVALGQGSAVEVVEPGSGLLVGESATELAGAIRDLVEDPDRRSAMGAAGRRLFEEQYTIGAMVLGIGELLERAVVAAQSDGAGVGT